MLLARAAQRFQTGDAWHADIGNHHADFLSAEDFQGLFAGRNRHGFESLPFEERIEETALAGIVIDDQDARRLASVIFDFGWQRWSPSFSWRGNSRFGPIGTCLRRMNKLKLGLQLLWASSSPQASSA